MITTNQGAFTVTSSVFTHGAYIPSKYTCEGEDISPPLSFNNLPIESKSILVILDDPDAPKGVFDHWIIWDITPAQMLIENDSPGIEGKNGFGNTGYNGPCPSSGIHKYFFTVYALDTLLNLDPGTIRSKVEEAMKGHILASATLIGLYRKMNDHLI